MKNTTPLTPAQKVKRSQNSLLARGGRRPTICLQPDVVQALDALIAAGYARTASAVIAKAILKAADHEKNAR